MSRSEVAVVAPLLQRRLVVGGAYVVWQVLPEDVLLLGVLLCHPKRLSKGLFLKLSLVLHVLVDLEEHRLAVEAELLLVVLKLDDCVLALLKEAQILKQSRLLLVLNSSSISGRRYDAHWRLGPLVRSGVLKHAGEVLNLLGSSDFQRLDVWHTWPDEGQEAGQKVDQSKVFATDVASADNLSRIVRSILQHRLLVVVDVRYVVLYDVLGSYADCIHNLLARYYHLQLFNCHLTCLSSVV